MNAKPLAGIRVLTLEQFGAGPYGTMFLAELGAEVIKIEPPEGDPSRQVGPHGLGKDDSQYFQAWNLGKKSVTLDIKSAEGRRQFEALVKSADCVVNNLRGTQPAKLGIDYESLKHLKPSIVCLHISAYGRSGERADWPGYDFLMQAEAGLMELTGDPEGAPTRVGVSLIDSMSGLTGIVGLLSCLLRARSTGQGCDVETCLFDVAVHQLTYPGTWYLNEGDVSPRVPRSAHLALAPVQTFPTRDGWIFVMCMTQILAVAGRGDGAAGSAERPAFRRSQHPRRQPRGADRCAGSHLPHAHDGRMAGAVQRPAAGRTGLSPRPGARQRLRAQYRHGLRGAASHEGPAARDR